MSLASHLSGFTTLTPPELVPEHSPAARERRKGAQQKAEDFIYTLNHAITCLSLTDFLIAPFFSTVFGWNICGHGHDHGKDGHSHDASSHLGGGEGTAGSTAASRHVHGAWCNHEGGLSATSSAEEFKAAFDKTIKTQDKPARPKNRGGFTKLIAEAPEIEGPPRYEHTAEFVGPPKPPAPEPAPTPSYTSYTGHSYSPPSPPPKPSVGQRVTAWWNELRASPLAYLKKQYPGFKEWAIGEAVGDIGAVPFTLAMQHFVPGVMTGIQHGLEPIVGHLMRKRAERAAEHWADKHGLAHDAQQVVDHAQELYRYEIRHLPQMVMWTLSSVGINYGVMKWRNPGLSIGNFAKGKAMGAAITASLVFGARTFAPDRAHAWDSTLGGKVVVPITKKVGRLFGVEARDIDDFHKRRMDEEKLWLDRVKEPHKQTLTPER